MEWRAVKMLTYGLLNYARCIFRELELASIPFGMNL